MALVFTDLTKESTSTTGTGTLTLTGAVAKYQSFANIGTGNTTYYRIESGNDSEVGVGTYNGTLSRDTVYMSIIAGVAGTTKIDVATGATVSCVYPAERAVYLSETGTLGVGGASAVNKLTVADTVLATGTGAGSLVDLSQTWNNATGNPTAIKLNVTNTASGSTSKLMDLRVNGSSLFNLSTTGATISAYSTAGYKRIVVTGATTFHVDENGIQTNGKLRFASGNSAGDLILDRDAANTLAQRNGVNSQTLRIYNTYTDASNYERSALSFVTYSGALYAKLAAESAGTGAANIGIALSPKGTGAITAQVPDGTTAGGNARGANSVDLQTVRGANDQVASGNNSVILGGGNCVASGASSVAIGQVARAIGQSSIAIGYGTGASGIRAVAIGGGTSQDSLLASGNYSVVLGGYNNIASSQMSMAFGEFAISNKFGQVATGITSFSASADCQYSYLGFAGATTTATTTEIFLKNSSPNRATIPNSTTWAADIDIVARSTSGTENAYFKRRLVIQKGTTAASTTLIGTVQTVGTDIGTTNMLAIATPITLTADTTNGALKLEVTGIAATNIRWVAKVSLVEVGFA